MFNPFAINIMTNINFNVKSMISIHRWTLLYEIKTFDFTKLYVSRNQYLLVSLHDIMHMFECMELLLSQDF